MDPPKTKIWKRYRAIWKIKIVSGFSWWENWIQNRSQNKFMQVRHASQDIFFWKETGKL